MDISDEIVINIKLKAIGETNGVESLKPNVQKYIKGIEEIVRGLDLCRSESLKTYKNSAINKSYIVERLGIARQTIYNNNILERYIEYSREQQLKSDLFRREAMLIDRIVELEHQIYLMQQRDASIEHLSYQLQKQNEQLGEQITTNQKLEEENHRLSNELLSYNKRNKFVSIKNDRGP
ncbi:hypothetical protein ACFFNY_30280 [Paenibacillus hodogayensis]|uniref:Uncharacterized protein n=1 Tax=Paenibacillus hodogayensis TaxID=279208 RepID=A0ABV5W655_9BACL